MELQAKSAAELALLLSGTQARREASSERIAELAGAVDEGALLQYLRRQRITLLILRRLLEDTDRRLSSQADAHIAWTEESLRNRGAMFRLATDVVTETLEANGIPALNLKGAVLAESIHGDEASRVYSDLDVLVRSEQLREAARHCRTLGYGDPVGEGNQGDLPTLHLVLLSERSVLPTLELHWRVHWYECRFAADMLSRSIKPGRMRRPDPIDELASLLLFYERDGFAGLRQAADIAAWWDRFGTELAPGALGRHCARYPGLESAWRAAALVSERVVGLPGRRLLGDRQQHLRRREQIAARLANWELEGDPDQISADATLIDGLCAPEGERRTFIRHLLAPDAASIQKWYGLGDGARWRIRMWAVLHPLKMIVRYCLAIWSARSGNRAAPTQPSSARSKCSATRTPGPNSTSRPRGWRSTPG